MKNGDEMARDVLKRISKYETEKRQKRQILLKNVSKAGLICISVVTVFVVTNAFIYASTDKHIWEHVINVFNIGTQYEKESFESVKSAFQSDIQELKNGKYENLRCNDFQSSIEEVEGVYNIEIQSDNSYKKRTFLENFKIMNQVIDKFFLEDFDKSYLKVDFNISDEETIYVDYNDIETECVDEKYNKERSEFIFGNNTAQGGYMVQISESLNNVWFSRFGLGDIGPFNECKKMYIYLSGVRQDEDVELKLADRSIMLSEMENNVLNYLNSEEFPLPVSEDIDLAIGDVRVIDNGTHDGVSFNVRRVYKGVHFEYGSNSSNGTMIDVMDNDGGEIDYAVSTHPDTILTFGRLNGNVVETGYISEMLSLGTALDILSDKLDEESIYEVQGVELIYRNAQVSKEREEEVDDILVPKWKIIVASENVNQCIIYYVDVVTGDVTYRYEYFYE